jgi:hypothetical protein
MDRYRSAPNSKSTIGCRALGAALVLAAALVGCEDKPRPPSGPPVPRMEAGDAQRKIFHEERRALERAKEAAPALEKRGRDMRERIEQEAR